jgi:hypothetical protein
VKARGNFRLNLLIRAANFVQISDHRLGPDGHPSVSPPNRVRERKAARLVLLAAFSYNGVTYIATPAERCRSE